MVADRPDPRTEAVEELRELGLSTYAARTFVTLVALGSGTARDVSEASDVPRTRVYDAVDELHERGLVDVQEADPRTFWPISSETTSRKFQREFAHRTSHLGAALDEIEPVERRAEQRGVWTVDGSAATTDRVVEFFDAAEEEIVYMSVDELLEDRLLDALARAAERGIDVKIAGMSPEAEARIDAVAPGAQSFQSLWLWSDTPAGRLLLVDRERTLASVLVSGDGTDAAGPTETAIWGAGETNSLVVVLKGIFTWRLDDR